MIQNYWKNWMKAACIRALKTVCQAALAAIGSTAMLTEVHWGVVGSTAALAGMVSLLTSLAGLPEVKIKERLEEGRC